MCYECKWFVGTTNTPSSGEHAFDQLLGFFMTKRKYLDALIEAEKDQKSRDFMGDDRVTRESPHQRADHVYASLFNSVRDNMVRIVSDEIHFLSSIPDRNASEHARMKVLIQQLQTLG